MGSPRRNASLVRPAVDEDDDLPPPKPEALRRARKALEDAPVVTDVVQIQSDEPTEKRPRKTARSIESIDTDRVVDSQGIASKFKHLAPGESDAATPENKFAPGRELAALLYVAFAAFLVLALASYDLRGGADWVGMVGARLASTFVGWFGLVSWAIPLELILFAVPYVRSRPSILTTSRVAGDVMLLTTGTALVHVGAGGRPVFGGHLSGGAVGELFGEVLRSLFSTVGTFLVGITIILLVLVSRAAFSFIRFAQKATQRGAQAANAAKVSVQNVHEAWVEARELERAAEVRTPRLVPAVLAEGLPDNLGDHGLRPPFDESGVHLKAVGMLPSNAPVRVATDTRVSPETHAIAQKLAGLPDGPDSYGKLPIGGNNSPENSLEQVLLATPTPPRPQVAGSRNAGHEKQQFVPALKPSPSLELPHNVQVEPEPASKGFTGETATESPVRASFVSSPIVVPASDESMLPVSGEKAKRKPRTKRDFSDGSESLPMIASASPDAALQVKTPLPANVVAAQLVAGEQGEFALDPDQDVVLDADIDPLSLEADLPSDGEYPDALVVEHEEAAPLTPVKRIVRVRKSYRLPGVELLEMPPTDIPVPDRALLLEDAKALVSTLATYKVIGEVREIHPGPVVTTFELEPRIGTKVREVEGLANDLRLSLAKESVRIVAPIPGKNRIGFELPNAHRLPVNFRELVEDRRFHEAKGALPVILGRDIVGAPAYADLAAMPHLLVAGATGAGKSVGLNVMLTSLLYRRTPEELRMIMIDPKVVELAPFDRIPHMLLPVVTDMKQALNALRWCVDEMERRYQLLAQAGVKNITSYNLWVERVVKGEAKNPLPKTITALDHNNLPEEIVSKHVGEQKLPEKLPYLVVVVDEFADLMMSVGKGEVEPPIARLAQKARASGIHVVLATQRPSVDVITGMIKANFPTRIAFRVSQRVDSRTILDAQGAEHLLGKGDMLVSLNGQNGLKRIQCPFVSEEEVQRVTDFLRAQGEPTFDESILAPRDDEGADPEEEQQLSPKDQEIYERAVELVKEARKCSTSWLQRKMGLGYNKAARFVDRMERLGVVGPSVGAGKDREVME